MNVPSDEMFSHVTDHALTSSLSSRLLGNEVTGNLTSASPLDMATEKHYEQFVEVQVAVWIDRFYIPVVVTVGLLGNFLCFVTLVFTSLRHTSTCVYMAAIAVLDSMILILDLCVLIRGYLGHTEFYIRNDWTCGFHNFLFYFSIHLDILVLQAMTVDRFIVVKFPLKAQSLCTPQSAIKAIVVLGLFSFALNFQIFFNRRLGPIGSLEDPLKCWYPDPDVDFFMRKIYTWIDASIYSFCPFLLLIILNILIIRQLKHSRAFSKQFMKHRDGKNPPSSNNMKVVVDGDTYNSDVHTSDTNVSVSDVSTTVVGQRTGETNCVSTVSGGNTGGTARGGGGSSKKAVSNANITVMLLLVSFTFLVLTSPVVIVLLYKRYHWLPSSNQQRAYARLTHAIVDNLMYTNHAVNFVLYCVSGRRFRKELKRLVVQLFCRS